MTAPKSLARAPGTWTDLSLDFATALARLPEALQKEGFGVVSQIDLQATFKAKLGVEFKNYRILGACIPSFALKALQTEPKVGVLLPCNVVLYEREDGKAVLGAIDPVQSLGGAAGGELDELARTVAEKIGRVVAAMQAARP